MKTFDVFLCDRITSLNATIETLVSKPILTLQDTMVLSAIIKEVQAMFSLGELSADFKIKTEVSKLISKVSVICSHQMKLDAAMDFGKCVYTTTADKNIQHLRTQQFQIYYKRLIQAVSEMSLQASLSNLIVMHSLGDAKSEVLITSDAADIVKTTFVRMNNKLLISGAAPVSNIKTVSVNKTKLSLSSSHGSMFYQGYIEEMKSSMALLTKQFEISDPMSMGAAKTTFYFSASNADTSLVKQMGGKTEFSIDCSVSIVPEKIVHSNTSDLVMSSESGDAAYHRRRTLGDMDLYTLDEFDNMTLKDIDYIEY